MIVDYFRNNTEFNNTLRRENAQLLNVKAGDMYFIGLHILCFWTLSIVLSLSKNAVLFIFFFV
jgi:hypothetical protein